MKTLFLSAGLLVLLSMGVHADDTAVSPKGAATTPVAVDPKGEGDFSGTISAIQESGGSFTVLNADGKVKIFTLPEDQKGKLTVGQKVTVSFTQKYSWPLHARSVTVSGQ